MEKSSLIKIAAALSLISLYTFFFGIIRVVQPIDTYAEATETGEHGDVGETDDAAVTTTIDASNEKKPSPADYGVPVTSYYYSEQALIPEPADSSESGAESSNVIDGPKPTSATTTAFETTTSGDSVTGDTSVSRDNYTEPVTGVILRVNNGGTHEEGSAEEIVARVVQKEMGSGFQREALKALAVASFTYIKHQNELGKTPDIALAETASVKVRECVAEVKGQGVYYNGEYIQAVYCASSAGYTSSAAKVWGTDLPYLKSVKCPFDEDYDPNYGRTASFTSSEIMLKVLKQTGIELTGDPAFWFKTLSWYDNVYVGEMSIGGKTTYTKGGSEVKITGRDFREKIMEYGLRSAAFSVSYDSKTDKFTFTTYGYGHGAGLSQNGADILASRMGYDYIDILKYYYTGTEVY